MRVIEYHPNGVCSRLFKITVDGDIVVSLEVTGGCNGNLQGISTLVKGMKIKDVITKLDGIKCRGSMNGQTSCPDQIAKALKTL